MFEAYARTKGTDEWRPVTYCGQPFHAGREILLQMLAAMRFNFARIEYEVRPA
jgi:hypothetical protein